MYMLREQLADYAHRAWSGWVRHQFGKGILNEDGSWTMPKWAVDRWIRQMNTPFQDLSPEEQESDFAEADRILEIVSPTGQKGWIPEGYYPRVDGSHSSATELGHLLRCDTCGRLTRRLSGYEKLGSPDLFVCVLCEEDHLSHQMAHLKQGDAS